MINLSDINLTTSQEISDYFDLYAYPLVHWPETLNFGSNNQKPIYADCYYSSGRGFIVGSGKFDCWLLQNLIFISISLNI